jgi:hypothetical protein
VIELADLIRDLRSEMETAVATAPPSGLRFELGPIELEVSIGVERSGSTGAKARFWVLELGTDGAAAKTSFQTVKLTLNPHVGSSGRSPFVSGPEAEAGRER